MTFWTGRPPLDRFRGLLIVAASTLAATVAGLAFWVSFEAISAYAVQIRAFPSSLRYCAPLLVDSFTVLATVFLLWLALAGERQPLRKTWDAYYAWALIVAATAASAYLNAAHVPADAATEARWVAGAVPVTLLASVHLLVLLLLRLLAWTPTSEPIRETAPGVGERRASEAPPPASSVPAAAKPAPDARPGVGERVPGVAPTLPPAPAAAPATDRGAERSRLIRERLAAKVSGAKIITELREQGLGTSTERVWEEIRRVKAESNGSTQEQREQVRA